MKKIILYFVQNFIHTYFFILTSSLLINVLLCIISYSCWINTIGGYLNVLFVVTGNNDLIYFMAASVSFGKSLIAILLSSSNT